MCPRLNSEFPGKTCTRCRSATFHLVLRLSLHYAYFSLASTPITGEIKIITNPVFRVGNVKTITLRVSFVTRRFTGARDQKAGTVRRDATVLFGFSDVFHISSAHYFLILKTNNWT